MTHLEEVFLLLGTKFLFVFSGFLSTDARKKKGKNNFYISLENLFA